MSNLTTDDSRSAAVKGEAKYQRLARILKADIRAGRRRPGDRLPSFPQMREMYGATPATVERVYKVLEQDGLIRREMRRGIFVADPRESRFTGVIGCISTGLATSPIDPYWSHLMLGIRRAAQEAQLQILLIDHLSHCNWEKIDAAVIVGGNEETVGGLPPGLMSVSLLREISHMPAVVANEEEGGFRAVQHLIDLGHRRISTLLNPGVFADRRRAGIERGLEERGLVLSENFQRQLHLPQDCSGRSFSGEGYRFMQKWLRDGWSTLGSTAIIAHNDEVAIGVMRALGDAGFDVPQDVSVVGFDGTEISEHCHPTLTTVKVPLEDIGARGLRQLADRLNANHRNGWEEIAAEQPEPKTVVLDVELLRRGSTAPAPKAKTKSQGDLD